MRNLLIPIAIVVIVIGLYASLYTLNEAEQGIVLQFGKPVGGAVTDAGLHMKIPFIQNVLRFEKRIMEWDGDANEIPTADNKYIYIDAFARWRISDALNFYRSARNEIMGQSRIDDVIDGAVRDEFSNRVMTEIIRSTDRVMMIHDEETQDETMVQNASEQREELRPGARQDIVDAILETVVQRFDNLDMGIEVIDIQVKRINYNPQVQSKLFSRMISEQNRIAEKYRAQGQGKKQEIMGMQIQRKKEILSGAYLKSQTIRGEADALAVNIYAESYNQAPEFYNFMKALETYKTTVDSTTKLILSTDNRYLRYLTRE